MHRGSAAVRRMPRAVTSPNNGAFRFGGTEDGETEKPHEGSLETPPTSQDGDSVQTSTLFNELLESVKKVCGIVWSGGCLGMVLY